MNNVYSIRYDSQALKSWLSEIKTDAAGALLPAIEDGVFDKFLNTANLLDICLDTEDRSALLPFSKQIKIPAGTPDYSELFGRAPEPIQAVILANVLGHIANPWSLLRTIYRTISIGGVLVVCMPDNGGSRPFTRQILTPAHGKLYTIDRLILQMQTACGANSFRLRFAKDYDNEVEAPREALSATSYTTIAVFEKVRRPKADEEAELINISRIGEYACLPQDSIVVANPKLLLSGGLSISDVKSIIVLKTDHIGDFCMVIPQFVELRSTFPSATITLVCGSWNKELAESLNIFDEIVDCNYHKESEKINGQTEVKKLFLAQMLGEKLNQNEFDLAIDFRTQSDSRHLLRVVNARVRAGVGSRDDFDFLDIALPNLEAFHQNSRRNVPERGNIDWNPTAFLYSSPHSMRDGVAICQPLDEGHFIWGPYQKLNAGSYDGTLNLRLFGPADAERTEIIFDIATNVQVVLEKKYVVTSKESEHEFRFDAYVDLDNVEFRVRLTSRPAAPPSFIFMGIKLKFVSASPFRRVLPIGSVHVAEHITLLLALIRSRLSDAVDTDTIRSRLSRGAAPVVGSAKFVALAPLSNSLLRDWPADEYVDLGRSILRDTMADILLVGSGEQEGELDLMANEIADTGERERISVLVGAHWSEVVARIIGAEATITNNSGIGHLAAILGARSIGIYSASHQVIEWGPLGRGALTLQASVNCGPCGFDTLPECANGHRCLRGVSHVDVLAALRKACGGIFRETLSTPTASKRRSVRQPSLPKK